MLCVYVGGRGVVVDHYCSVCVGVHVMCVCGGGGGW